MKKLAVIQPFYIPWKGYFDIISAVDEFILFEDVQFPRRFWVNRNCIKTPKGVQWLTIPMQVKGLFNQTIKEAKVSSQDWNRKHWEVVRRNYAQAEHFRDYRELFEQLYLGCDEEYICEIDRRFIMAICNILRINTDITLSSDYDLIPGKTERLVHLCQQTGADEYISGPAAKAYIDENLFRQAKVDLRWVDYSGYPEYRQLYPPFVHEVSVLDLIFNVGADALSFMKRGTIVEAS